MRRFIIAISVFLAIQSTLCIAGFTDNAECFAFQGESVFGHSLSQDADHGLKFDNAKSDQMNAPAQNRNNVSVDNFDGNFNFSKSVDTNGDYVYIEAGKTVKPGDAINYKIDWKFNQINDQLTDPYIYDSIPQGTKYVAGKSTPWDLSYSVDDGSSWKVGEPPDGSPAGTKLRWGPLKSYWSSVYGIPFDPNSPVDYSVLSYSSAQPSLVIDKFGMPNVGFIDYARTSVDFDILHTRFDGTQWVGANGLPYDWATTANARVSFLSNDSDGPCLAMDNNGFPCMVWGEKIIPSVITSWETQFVRWNGSGWVNAQGQAYNGVNANISNTPSTSYGTCLAIDSSNNPHVVWYDFQGAGFSFDIMYVRWNGLSWVNAQGIPYDGVNAKVSKTTSSSEFPVIRLDGNDNPCIAWSEGTFGGYDIVCIKWNGTQWVGANGLAYNPATGANANVSRNAGFSSYPSLAIDSDNNPCLAWHDYTYGGTSIMCVKWDGTQWVGGNGFPYNNLTGANGIVASCLFIPNGASAGRLSAKLTSVRFDSGDRINLAFWGNIAGNRGVFFVKSSSSGWLNADGNPFDQVSGLNAFTYDGMLSTYTNFANTISLDLDKSDIPYIAVYTQTSLYYSVSVIKHVPITAQRELYFSTKVDKPYAGSSSICNTASFSHAMDGGIPLMSNTVCNQINSGSSTGMASLAITKTSGSIEYDVKDVFEFTITVKNTGSEPVADVEVADLYPKDLVFVSSNTPCQVGMSKVKFLFGVLDPGKLEVIKLKFRLNPETIVEDCITVTNEAIATSGSVVVKDSAVFNVCSAKAPCPLYFEIKWSGLVKNIGKTNAEITGTVIVQCGSSPYAVKVDWGDGTRTTGTIKNSSNVCDFGHSYLSPGTYEISVTVSDQYLTTRTVTKTVKIE
jgi:uncharacterized repeat protein (TIGR01451 family)